MGCRLNERGKVQGRKGTFIYSEMKSWRVVGPGGGGDGGENDHVVLSNHTKIYCLPISDSHRYKVLTHITSVFSSILPCQVPEIPADGWKRLSGVWPGSQNFLHFRLEYVETSSEPKANSAIILLGTLRVVFPCSVCYCFSFKMFLKINDTLVFLVLWLCNTDL